MMREPTLSPMILAEGTEFARGYRLGRVYRSAPTGCEVIWHEYIDLETGEVIKAIADFIPAEIIGREVSRGSIRILRLPQEMGPNVAEMFQGKLSTAGELARASNRECYVLAAQNLIDKGKIKPVRADFVKNFDQLLGDGLRAANARASRNTRGAKCGTALAILRPRNVVKPSTAGGAPGWRLLKRSKWIASATVVETQVIDTPTMQTSFTRASSKFA
jgi:putative transposase